MNLKKMFKEKSPPDRGDFIKAFLGIMPLLKHHQLPLELPKQ